MMAVSRIRIKNGILYIKIKGLSLLIELPRSLFSVENLLRVCLGASSVPYPTSSPYLPLSLSVAIPRRFNSLHPEMKADHLCSGLPPLSSYSITNFPSMAHLAKAQQKQVLNELERHSIKIFPVKNFPTARYVKSILSTEVDDVNYSPILGAQLEFRSFKEFFDDGGTNNRPSYPPGSIFRVYVGTALDDSCNRIDKQTGECPLSLLREPLNNFFVQCPDHLTFPSETYIVDRVRAIHGIVPHLDRLFKERDILSRLNEQYARAFALTAATAIGRIGDSPRGPIMFFNNLGRVNFR